MPDEVLSSADRSLYLWEKICSWFLVPIAIVFGALTLMRSAYDPDNRKTDFGVYARAAWSVREGKDLYSTSEDNGWHYVYPPPIVLIFLPLADPPHGADRTGYVSFPFGVTVWYLINLLLLIYTINTFANVILPDARRYSRRWWYARLIPFDLCAGALGFTLSRGQANILLIALIAAMFASAMRGRRFTSGLFLAAAICLKVFPGLLLAFPLVRRDWRALAGVAVGSFVLLGVLPTLTWGFEGAIRENTRYLKFVVMPGLNKSESQTAEDADLTKKLEKELHDMTAKHSQSFMAILHYIRHPASHRPKTADADIRMIHWAISGLMVIVTLTAGELARRRRTLTNAEWLLFLGALINAMLLIVPMSHMHYYSIMLPQVMAIWLFGLTLRPNAAIPSPKFMIGLITWAVLAAIPLFDGDFFVRCREIGVAMWPSFALWMCGIVLLIRGK